ncbi:MAG TPA: DUF6485 family protein [Candidatus Omnitrophota bacterium]|nr:DUF6485 family protein [Candidatus Omnitrophota bacterium]
MNCPNKTKNLDLCNCSYPGCPRHGLCCECLHYHRQKGALPACYFPTEEEKAYNRSIEYFIDVYNKKKNSPDGEIKKTVSKKIL